MTSAESERLRQLVKDWRQTERTMDISADASGGFSDGLMKAWRELEQTLDELGAP